MKTPTIIGLTGSIGMGKSTVAAMFADAGVPVFDADATVRRLQGPNGALIDPIEAAFPGSTDTDGVIRDRLGQFVFTQPDKLHQLEAIVHPAVAAERMAFLQQHSDALLILFDIPLLFEKGGEDHVDLIVVVSTSPEIQRARVLKRDGMTPEKFAHILSLQTPDSEKRARADCIIDTSGPLENTRAAVTRLIARLSASSDR